ncbi:sigma-54 interaction domain-containing protein [Mucilaginibacter aquaedulcis]|uniref:sigma-54 interaction domain-containing protein n=1 Tax=Mucilaginibacter aquaedulcis TaxID=1187081 RepID=UPI0025B373F5|nr:sigma 54-interacting transcriptional regulator [Mucilaginibacter aquaedulcis]MDN3546752.1 sigma 54-interacting transcriptional regulator [Mucilaginibacter aquaedulcis]
MKKEIKDETAILIKRVIPEFASVFSAAKLLGLTYKQASLTIAWKNRSIQQTLSVGDDGQIKAAPEPPNWFLWSDHIAMEDNFGLYQWQNNDRKLVKLIPDASIGTFYLPLHVSSSIKCIVEFKDMVTTRFAKDTLKIVADIFVLAARDIIGLDTNEKRAKETRSKNYRDERKGPQESSRSDNDNSKLLKLSEETSRSETMRAVIDTITLVASTNSTVLLLGETGVGKELIANTIHLASQRSNASIVKVNCAAIPGELMETELFGYEKGSFTGATDRKIGMFEAANHGTLFLDEIGDLPIHLQVKLLRSIQEREIVRIGGTKHIKIDVRIIAATNKDLTKMVNEGLFRADLYYRLCVIPISIPPLRKRSTDIPSLVTDFIMKFNNQFGKRVQGTSAKVMKTLLDYHWPGNVRELENLIERHVLLTAGSMIRHIDLPAEVGKLQGKTPGITPFLSLQENERQHILKALAKTKGKLFGDDGAAKLLDVNISTLNSKIKKLGIQKKTIVKIRIK